MCTRTANSENAHDAQRAWNIYSSNILCFVCCPIAARNAQRITSKLHSHRMSFCFSEEYSPVFLFSFGCLEHDHRKTLFPPYHTGICISTRSMPCCYTNHCSVIYFSLVSLFPVEIRDPNLSKLPADILVNLIGFDSESVIQENPPCRAGV